MGSVITVHAIKSIPESRLVNNGKVWVHVNEIPAHKLIQGRRYGDLKGALALQKLDVLRRILREFISFNKGVL